MVGLLVNDNPLIEHLIEVTFEGRLFHRDLLADGRTDDEDETSDALYCTYVGPETE